MAILCETLRPGWFLVRTKNHCEQRTLTSLAEKGFEGYCPMMASMSGDVPLFPQYLFVRVNDYSRFHELKWAPGLKQIVQFSQRNDEKKNNKVCPELQPIPNGDNIIQQVRHVEYTVKINKRRVKKDELMPGDKVKYKNSLFIHLDGLFIKKQSHTRGLILMQYIENRVKEGKDIETEKLGSKKIAVPLGDIEKN